jgi:hypothetical protein
MQYLCITKEKKAVVTGVVIRAEVLSIQSRSSEEMDWEDKDISNFTWEPNIDPQFIFFFLWRRDEIGRILKQIFGIWFPNNCLYSLLRKERDMNA